MRLINVARSTSPVLNREQGKLLDEQSGYVQMQLAEKDYETAEFYRRTGHPGSAWFYYELVIRRYPNVKPWYDNAMMRQKELKAEIDELNAPGFMAATRRFWKYYVLGYEIPKIKEGANIPGTAELPEQRPTETLPTPSPALPAPSALPQDLRPR
jgi:hypothetical protein